MNDHAPSPQVIFLSFMVVGAGYLISNFFWFGSLILLVASDGLFPEAHRVWSLEGEQFKEAMAADPYSVVPISLFWCVLFLGILGSLIGGFSVVRSAPFSKYGHVIFTATLVAISWLQQLISGNGPDEFRWMILLSMFAMAGGMLLGGKLGYSEDPPTDTEFIGGE
jgi:hypothetical protein